MQIKTCSRCKKELPIENFSRNKTKKDGFQSQCKACSSYFSKTNYVKNKEHILSRNNKTRLGKIKIYQEYKSKLKCSKCGEDDSACLDFHHIDPSTKLFSIGHEGMGYGIKKIFEEIDKCIVLCANCHRKHHYYENSNNSCRSSVGRALA